MVIQDEHSEAFIYPILLLMQQGVPTNEIHALRKKGTAELSMDMLTLGISSSTMGRVLLVSLQWDAATVHNTTPSAPTPQLLGNGALATMRKTAFTT